MVDVVADGCAPPQRQAWLTGALVALCVTEITSWGVLYYAFPVVADTISADTGWSRSAVAAAFSASLLLAAAVGVPVGRWLDRHGPRSVMTLGSVVAVPATLLVAAAPTFAVFVVGWLVAGAAMAAVLYQPAFAALTRWYGDRRVAALTTLTLAAGFSSTIFAPLTGLLLGRTGWRETYVVLAIVLAAVTIPLHFFGLRPSWPVTRGIGQTATHQEISLVLRTSAFRFLAASFAIAGFASFAVVFNIVPLLTSRGLSTELAALALGLGGVGQVAGRLAYRRLAASTSVRGRAVVLLAAEGMSIAALAIVPGPAGALIALTLLVGAIRGMFTLLQATAITDRWGPDYYGTLSGVLAVPITTAMAVAPWAGAAVASALGSYPASLGVFAALCLVAAGLAWLSH
jgi:predicted MFS family arabinose efflux permease